MDYPQTSWTLIGQYRDGNEAVLARFLEVYRQPICDEFKSYLPNFKPEEAEDLAHSFISEKFIAGDLLLRPQKGMGLLRAYLRQAIKNFLNENYRRQMAQKRGGSYSHTSLENTDEGELSSKSDFSQFDRLWAEASLKQAMASVEEAYSKSGLIEEFMVLRSLSFGEESGGGSRELPEFWTKLSGKTHRRRTWRFREQLRKELRKMIAPTVETDQEREDEYRYLLEILISQASVEF